MSLGRMTSEVAAVRAALERVGDVGPQNHGVLLRGELGSGRETIVRELRQLSRPNRPFVVVDVAAIPPELLESTLFGHEYSTFTGGGVVKRGAFETAENGTVLIREIAAIPLDLQPKVLRVLERRELRRVGSNVMTKFTGRVFSTTHCALEELVAIGWFRADLLAAIAMDADVTVPPLRERIADLPALLGAAKVTLDGGLLQRLARLSWRGNFHALDAFVRSLATRTPTDAVAELELLEAIEDNPDDDSPRLVYGDQLAARGDPRGELIQMQCRLSEAGPDRKIRAVERVLLEAHHKTWAGAALDAASSPAIQAQATFVRGFVDQVICETPILRRIDAVIRAAPLLTRVVAQGYLGSDCLVSPVLQKLAHLALTIPTLGAPSVAALAACPYLIGLRSLALSSGAPASNPDDPALRRVGVEALATSPHLAGVTRLAFESYELTPDNLATLLGDRAQWTLAELMLVEAELGPAELETIAAAPKTSALRLLDLRMSPIRAASATVLATATSFTNLTTLRVDQLDAEAREILMTSSVLAGAIIYDGNQSIR